MSKTTPNDKTREAERAQFQTKAGTDQMPTADDEAALENSGLDIDVASVGQHAEEMNERGANTKGEGRID